MKTLLLFTLLTLAAGLTQAQDSTRTEKRFLYTATAGTGVTFSTPSTTPFTLRITGYYHPAKRLYAGAGTGYSLYNSTSLIPLYGSIRYHFRENRRWIPYAECMAGHSFASSGEANGGFVLSPSAGISLALKKDYRLQASVGYEFQKLQRLKSHRDDYFTYEFKEELSHHVLMFTLGFVW